MDSLGSSLEKGFWVGKKVLITGHTGFKGSWLTFWLKESGALICGLSLDPITSPSLWTELDLDLKGFDLRFDIRSHDWVTKVREFEPEIVFHLAAQPLVVTGWNQPLMTFETNVIGTANLLNELSSIASVETILVTTTDKVYKLDGAKVARTESSELGGRDPYAASKAAVELLIESWPLPKKINIASARSGNVIGGGDWSQDRLIPDIVRSGIKKRELELRFPTAIRPWQHVIEPIHGYMMLAEAMHTKKFNGKSVNFGPSIQNQVTVEEIVKYCSQILPRELRFDTVIKSEKYYESEILILDSTLAKNEIGWTPVIDWKESVKISLDWYLGFLNGRPARELVSSNINYYLKKVKVL
jgi:CDP-glucose 4,6-dehydratase